MRTAQLRHKTTGLFLGVKGFTVKAGDLGAMRTYKTTDLPQTLEAVRLLFGITPGDHLEIVSQGKVDAKEIAQVRQAGFHLIVSLGTQSFDLLRTLGNRWLERLEILDRDLKATIGSTERDLPSIEEFIAFRADMEIELIRAIKERKTWNAIAKVAQFGRYLVQIENDLEGIKS